MPVLKLVFGVVRILVYCVLLLLVYYVVPYLVYCVERFLVFSVAALPTTHYVSPSLYAPIKGLADPANP